MENKVKKNIVMITRPICPPWNEASKNFSWELANRIKGYIFHLLTYGKFKPKARNIKSHRIYARPDLRLRFFEKIRLFNFLFRLGNEADLAHFLFTPSKWTSFLVKQIVLPRFKLRHGRRLKTIQSLATLDFSNTNKKNAVEILFADRIITYSCYTKNFLKKLGFKNVSRIYPGVDLCKYKPRPKSKSLLKKLGIEEKDRVLLYTGEYTRLGSMEIIMESLPLILKREENLKLILACRIKSDQDIERKKQIKDELLEKGLESKVIFIETFYPMKRLYNLADIFIFPLKQMGGKFDIALTVVEAMASGLPVVISDIKPLSEVIRLKDSALRLKENNGQELAYNVGEILQNQKMAARLKNRARENAVEFFDINTSAEQYGKIYAQELKDQ
ncbi:MAG: glycosyltransferase family 4 protein [Patescibacteria group bacterium]|nr:glycosyltransferase family 4 protein [Patescibacteria group bacterium]